MAKTTQVTLADIARHLGVSRTTVASVLLKSAGKNARVGKQTAERIRAAADELGYCPNVAAQRLAGKRSTLVGVLIDSYAPAPRYRQLAELERAADERGYRIMIGQSHGELGKIDDYVEDFIANGVAGAVCISHDYPDIGGRVVEAFARLPHVVYLGRPVEREDESNWVALDHAETSFQMVEHLWAAGRRQPVLCMVDTSYRTSRDRADGFAAALEEREVEDAVDRVVLWTGLERDWADPGLAAELVPLVEDVLARRPVDAILAQNDLMALQLVRALETLGRAVPGAIAVAGCDNLETTALVRPALTTIDQNDAAVARAGLDLLLALVEGAEPPADERRQLVRGRVVVRESTTGG